MEYSVPCECGAAVPVEAWSAGTTVDCACGREVMVPSLHQLRQHAGVPQPEALPEYRIPKMIERGELPGKICVQCGSAESPAVSLLAICEEVRSSSSEANEWLRTILWFLLFFTCGIHFFFVFAYRLLFPKDKGYGDWDGQGTAVLMPTALCQRCRSMYGFSSTGFWMSAIAWLALVGAAVAVFAWSQWVVAAYLAGSSLIPFAMTAMIHRQRQQTWKHLLRMTPIYSEVLDRFPRAKLREIRD